MSILGGGDLELCLRNRSALVCELLYNNSLFVLCLI